MTEETIQRTERGRFASGGSGNPDGRPRHKPKLEEVLRNRGADLIGLAVEQAQTNNEVLAGLLNLSAAIRIDEAVARFDKAAKSFGIAQLAMAPTMPGAH